MIGTRLAHYDILEKLGSGGMGDVYRGRDSRLGRDVAIKVLPPEVANDAERRARFEREATVVAGLKHPNIVTLHSIEVEGDVHFLTMELVEGRTLAAAIPAGGFVLEELLAIAVPLADALASAHAKGVVHRDLKPANVMLDGEGRVKVLDFGLAKLAETVDSSSETVTSDGVTREGHLLGTVAYMSPEQAEGLAVDHRSDLFSFGILLYQMATGKNPFQRGHTVSTLAAILKDTPPPLAPTAPGTGPLPKELVEIVRRCLEKSPDRRYASTVELRDRLRALQATLASGSFAGGAPASAIGLLRRPRVAVPLALGLLGAVALGGWLVVRSRRAAWAREVALPQIEKLLDASPGATGPGFWQAYLLGREAERILPDDPLLQRLGRRYARPLSLYTEPPGAQVSARPYGGSETDCKLLGETPIVEQRFVQGLIEVRIEKPGFEPVDDVLWSVAHHGTPPGYRMLPAGPAGPAGSPGAGVEGMSWVSGTAPILEIEGAPAGLHFPGIEGTPPQQLGDFFVDRYEVTQRDFKRFVAAGGYSKPELWREPFVDGGRTLTFAEAMARFVDRTGQPGPANWEVGDFPEGRDADPVSGVSWFEAAAFAAFAGKRLPSIYHWDHVAFTWGSASIVPASNLGGDGPHPVGSGAARNRFGTEDLGGNVREWCTNGDSRGGRFILGGGWDDPAYAFNDAYAQSPWDRSATNGFRCIKEVATSRVDPALEATIELPFRDFRSEPRVPDETFAQYLTQFRYDATPLRAEVEERLEEEDYIRERISFDAAYGGERMTAYLFLPKHGTPPYQTVVVFPGSGAIHTRSSADVAPGRGSFAPKGGRALLMPVYKSTYERGDGLVSDYPDTSNNWKDHIIMWGKDFRRSIDYVETRKDLDAGRIAYLGLSWGSAMAPFMLAIEPRVKAGVLVVAGLNFQKALPEVDELPYTMRVKVPILMLNGKYDFFFPYDTSQLPFFDLLATPPEHKKLVVQESSHAFSQTELAREAIAWLDKYLGPVR